MSSALPGKPVLPHPPSRRGLLRTAGAVAVAMAAGPALLSATAGEEARDARSEPSGKPQPPPFRLGIVTYNIAAQWDLPTILKVLQNVGISTVELRTTHKHGVEPSLSADERREVKKRFADAGIDFWGCGSVCEFQSPEPAQVQKNIETCKQFVALVANLGGHMVKVRPNGLPKGVPVEKTLEQIGKALIECGKAAESAGIEVCMEVHGPGTQEPANAKTIMDHCGHPKVGLTWNSNQTDVKDGSVAESFHLLRPWIRSCHINELYKNEAPPNGPHADTAKSNAIPFYPYRELFRLMRQTGYDRVTMCEVAKTPPDVASGEELLRYYKALWTELSSGT